MLLAFGFVLLVTVSPVKAGYVEGHYSLASMHKTCHSQTLVNLSQTGPLLVEFDSSKMPVKYLRCSLTILPPSGLTAFLKHARLGYSTDCSDEFIKLGVGETGSEAICGEVAPGSGNFANVSRSDFSPWRLFATSTSRNLTIIYQRKRVLEGNHLSSFRIAVTPMGQNCTSDSGYIPCGKSGYCVPAAVVLRRSRPCRRRCRRCRLRLWTRLWRLRSWLRRLRTWWLRLRPWPWLLRQEVC